MISGFNFPIQCSCLVSILVTPHQTSPAAQEAYCGFHPQGGREGEEEDAGQEGQPSDRVWGQEHHEEEIKKT